MSESETIDAILTAEIDAPVIDKKGYRPAVPVLKLAMILIARHGEETTNSHELGMRLGVSEHWARCVMQSLRLLGVVKLRRVAMLGGGRSGTRYTLNLPAIQALPRVARRATA